jgi:hypothetical protein
VLGLFAIAILRSLHLVLRSSASMVTQVSKVIISLYDLIIMMLLSAEKGLDKIMAKKSNSASHNTVAQEGPMAESTRHIL